MRAMPMLCILGSLAGTAAQPRWELAASMPSPRMDAASAVVGDTLYVIGGRQRGGGGPGMGDQGLSDVVEAYLPWENRWLEIFPQLPVPLADMACAVIEARVYLFGGTTTGNTVVSAIYSWRPGEESWAPYPGTLPVPLRGASALSLDGTSALLAGGSDSAGQYVGSTLRFTPGAGFMAEPALEQARSGAGAGLVQGGVVITGGYFHGPLGSTEVLTEGIWEEGPALPSARGSALSCQDSTLMFLVGGQGTGAPLDEVLSLVSSVGAWVSQEPMNYARARLAGGVAGGYLIVAGGTGPVGYQATESCERIPLDTLAALDDGPWERTDLPLRVWPNPFTAGFEACADIKADAPWVIAIHTVDGKLVCRCEGHSRTATVRLGAGAEWPDGTYVVTISGNTRHTSRRILKVR